MVMQAIKYPNRCVNHLFGYCGKNIQGETVSSKDQTLTYAGTLGKCEIKWAECKAYATNAMANPYRPELEGKKAHKVEAPAPSAGKRKEKPVKQESLV